MIVVICTICILCFYSGFLFTFLHIFIVFYDYSNEIIIIKYYYYISI